MMQRGTPDLDERLDGASPSAKLVAYVLENEGPLSMDRLAHCSRLPSSTVRYAVDSLMELGVVDARNGSYGVVFHLDS